MGMLINGNWSNENQTIKNGFYVRQSSCYKDDIPPSLFSSFNKEEGRFWLIGSLSCPWSHRTVILRSFKKLESFIPFHITGGKRIEGYPINNGEYWKIPGSQKKIKHLHQLYTESDPNYTGRVTLPILWDSYTQNIISNESSKIIRAFNKTKESNFNFVPEQLKEKINEYNALIYENLSNAVYCAGFAESQNAYDKAIKQIFSLLDYLENHLSKHRYLLGSIISEADWSLFPTLVRFDTVYFLLYRCSYRRLVDYPNLWNYTKDLYSWLGIRNTVNLDINFQASYENDVKHIFRHSPAKPFVTFLEPHNRDRLGPAQVSLYSNKDVNIDPKTLNIT